MSKSKGKTSKKLSKFQIIGIIGIKMGKYIKLIKIDEELKVRK